MYLDCHPSVMDPQDTCSGPTKLSTLSKWPDVFASVNRPVLRWSPKRAWRLWWINPHRYWAGKWVHRRIGENLPSMWASPGDILKSDSECCCSCFKCLLWCLSVFCLVKPPEMMNFWGLPVHRMNFGPRSGTMPYIKVAHPMTLRFAHGFCGCCCKRSSHFQSKHFRICFFIRNWFDNSAFSF